MEYSKTGSKLCASSTSIYIELNKKIESMYKLLHFVMMRFTYIGVIVPQLFTTGVNYFVNDLKNESFYLTSPGMCVYIL